MIQIEQVSKTFNKRGSGEIKALDRISVLIPKAEFTLIVGSNGSGKSTLLNMITGSLSPDEGKISIDDQDLTRLEEHERSKWISRMFQDPKLGTAPDLSILENFRLAALRTHSKTMRIGTGEAFRKIVREKISMINLGLEHKLDQPMGTLSGGQRQALALVMAIMDDSKVLLMDEPTAALDPKTSVVIMELAEKIIREFKLTAVLITHDVKDVIRFGDRVIQLAEGKIRRDLKGAEKKVLTLAEIVDWFGE
jgi:putative tryptophan/tyrosine transport system ATP-binding protein